MFKKLYILVTLLTIFFLQSAHTYASDFQVMSTFNIYLDEISSKVVRVEETLQIQTDNSRYYIPANTEQRINMPTLVNQASEENTQLKKNSLKVTDGNNRPLKYELVEENNTMVVKTQNPSNISPGNSFFVKVEYKTDELVNHNGNIMNLYLPGLHEDTIFEDYNEENNLSTTYTYQLAYHVPLDAPEPAYMSPETISQEVENSRRKYIFTAKERIDNTGWIQLGTQQYYYFKITQKVPKTDTLTPTKLNELTDWVSMNILEIALPKQFAETNQQVFLSNISPEMKRLRVDNEGNVIAIFETRANQEQTIEIEGYIKLSKSIIEIPDFTFEEYMQSIRTLNRLTIYTQSDQHWESNNPNIQEIASQITQENKKDGIMAIIRASYNFVIENLEYSNEKAKGDNPRIGALRALQGEPAVCMEYADLLIAILRAQNIPARAAIGYGNDPNQNQLDPNLASESGHQWVQVWLPDYGWLSIDPTWGETSREYIGGDLDHVLWYTIGNSEEKISETMIHSADILNSSILQNYEVVVEPLSVNNMPPLEELETLENLILKYQQDISEESELERVLKTTMFGRAVIFMAPIIVILIVVMTMSITISKLIKSRRN